MGVRCVDGADRSSWGETQWLTTSGVTIRTVHHWCKVPADANLLQGSSQYPLDGMKMNPGSSRGVTLYHDLFWVFFLCSVLP